MKRNRYVQGSLLLLAVLSTACEFTGKLTRRYRSATTIQLPDSVITSYVGVQAYAIEPEAPDPAKAKTLFDLTERGQREYLRQLAAKETTSPAYQASLTAVLSAKPASVELLDYTKFTKRVVVSVKNLRNGPADRISKVDIAIKFPDRVTLLSCNRLATEYQTLDLGKLSYANSNQAELTGSLTGGLSTGQTGTAASKNTDAPTNGATAERTLGNSTTGTSTAGQGLTAKVSASRTFAEEVLLRQRIVALNASIANNTLSLAQDGISGIDLTGNIIADLVFEAKGDVRVERTYSFSGLQLADGTPASFAKIKVKETLVVFPNYLQDITGELSYQAVYRQVLHGDRTISESDDRVELRTGNTLHPVVATLIRRAQFTPKLSYLALDGDPSKLPMSIAGPTTGPGGTLIFASYADARDFLVWLNQPGALAPAGGLGGAGHRLQLPGGRGLTPLNLAKLRIMPFL